MSGSAKVQITVLRDDLDARAVRWGEDITVYMSYLVPLGARDAAVSHLVRSLRAAVGPMASVHLERGQAIDVLLDSARELVRARPLLRSTALIRTAVWLTVTPFAASLLASSHYTWPLRGAADHETQDPPAAVLAPPTPPVTPSPSTRPTAPVTTPDIDPAVDDLPELARLAPVPISPPTDIMRNPAMNMPMPPAAVSPERPPAAPGNLWRSPDPSGIPSAVIPGWTSPYTKSA